jgi:hypothetical protein
VGMRFFSLSKRRTGEGSLYIANLTGAFTAANRQERRINRREEKIKKLKPRL